MEREEELDVAELRVAARFCAPPGVANGGVASGSLAAGPWWWSPATCCSPRRPAKAALEPVRAGPLAYICAWPGRRISSSRMEVDGGRSMRRRHRGDPVAQRPYWGDDYL
jgi:hypothetical protein